MTATINVRSRGRRLRTRIARMASCTALLGLVASAWSGCVVRRESDSCERQSDCAKGGSGRFCTGRGFCETECVAAADCPCGSFCAVGCGICLRNDMLGPATCVAYQRGLSTNEVLGACGRDIAERAADAAEASAASDDAGDAGTCSRPPTLPECLPSPPIDATSDSPSDSSSDAGDGEAGTDAQSRDAATESSTISDAASDTGGDQ